MASVNMAGSQQEDVLREEADATLLRARVDRLEKALRKLRETVDVWERDIIDTALFQDEGEVA